MRFTVGFPVSMLRAPLAAPRRPPRGFRANHTVVPGLWLVLATFGIQAATTSTTSVGSPEAARQPRLAVLNIELTGDLGGPQFSAEHAARLQKESDELRHELELSGLYRIVDTSPAQPLITRLAAQQAYLHDCNGCDLEIGKQLGADQVLVTWVDRVSGLILSLTYEFHDVASGQIVARKSYDFRGDNDAAWTHAIRRMVLDLKESSATHSAN
jgi:Protein of unknown function (DUF2380)